MIIATTAPIVNCPEAPILNNPVFIEKPTDSPVNIIGVAVYKSIPKPLMPSIKPPRKTVSIPENEFVGFVTNNKYHPAIKPIRADIIDGRIDIIFSSYYFILFAPDIYSPSSFAVISFGFNSATISPSNITRILSLRLIASDKSKETNKTARPESLVSRSFL